MINDLILEWIILRGQLITEVIYQVNATQAASSFSLVFYTNDSASWSCWCYAAHLASWKCELWGCWSIDNQNNHLNRWLNCAFYNLHCTQIIFMKFSSSEMLYCHWIFCKRTTEQTGVRILACLFKHDMQVYDKTHFLKGQWQKKISAAAEPKQTHWQNIPSFVSLLSFDPIKCSVDAFLWAKQIFSLTRNDFIAQWRTLVLTTKQQEAQHNFCLHDGVWVIFYWTSLWFHNFTYLTKYLHRGTKQDGASSHFTLLQCFTL